jgi:hypothetical protein
MLGRRKLKILHGPSNVASVASVLARAQRAQGWNADAVCNTLGRGVRPDYILGEKGVTGKRFTPFLLSSFLGYDVYHFYFDETYFGRSFRELSMLQRLGKKVVLTFLGCDVRDSKAELQKVTPTICQNCWPQGCSRNRTRLLAASKKASAVFVTTPDLMGYVPHAKWLPLPVASDLIPSHIPRPRVWTTRDPLTIFHAPTDPQKKGTIYLEAAIEHLEQLGQPVRLVLASEDDQQNIWSQAIKCDVAVDQLLSGVYGTFGAEMMLADMPLINRIDESVWPERPRGIINAGPDSITDVILRILDGRIDLQGEAAAAKAYAARHEAETVCKRFDAVYAREGEPG